MSLYHRYLELEGEVFSHYYLCHYRPFSAGVDFLSRSLVQFKAGHPVDLKAWLEVAVESLKNLIPKNTVIIRPLGHDESLIKQGFTGDARGLDILGNRLAASYACIYAPYLLSKRREIPPIKLLPKSDRSVVLEDCYQLTEWVEEPVVHVFIIDDILTSGSTVSAIVEIIRRRDRKIPISIFTLAYTYVDIFPQDVELKSQHYKWNPAGKWVAAEMEAGYLSFNYLRKLILEDGF